MISNGMKHLFKEKELIEISDRILKEITKNKKSGRASILALSGDLGAGKTTLTKEIAKKLGIKEKVVSPTFIIMKIYEVNKNSLYYKNFKKMVHIDAYRLEDKNELKNIGWGDITKDEDNLIVIEWPEIVKDSLDKDVFWVKLGHVDDDTRSLEF